MSSSCPGRVHTQAVPGVPSLPSRLCCRAIGKCCWSCSRGASWGQRGHGEQRLLAANSPQGWAFAGEVRGKGGGGLGPCRQVRPAQTPPFSVGAPLPLTGSLLSPQGGPGCLSHQRLFLRGLLRGHLSVYRRAVLERCGDSAWCPEAHTQPGVTEELWPCWACLFLTPALSL